MLPSVRIQDPKWAIDYLGKKVRAKLFQLERRFKKFKDELDEMALYLNNLGVNESNTYLYIQGHHLFDLVVSPIVQSVCDALRNDRRMKSATVPSIPSRLAPKWHVMRIVWAR